jgi:hypothetical protein
MWPLLVPMGRGGVSGKALAVGAAQRIGSAAARHRFGVSLGSPSLEQRLIYSDPTLFRRDFRLTPLPHLGIPKQDETHQMKEPPGIPDGSIHRHTKSDGAQIVSSELAILWVGNKVESDLLPLVKILHPRTLDRPHMDEDILAAIIGLDESIAFLTAEPLHRAFLCHVLCLSNVPTREMLPPAARIVGPPQACVKRAPSEPRGLGFKIEAGRSDRHLRAIRERRLV